MVKLNSLFNLLIPIEVLSLNPYSIELGLIFIDEGELKSESFLFCF